MKGYPGLTNLLTKRDQEIKKRIQNRTNFKHFYRLLEFFKILINDFSMCRFRFTITPYSHHIFMLDTIKGNYTPIFPRGL